MENNRSNLPEQVRASIEIDKKKYAQSLANNTNSTPTAEPKLLGKTKKKNSKKNIFIIAGIFIGVLFLCLILSLLNVDTKIIKITLQAAVVDMQTLAPIKDVSVYSADESTLLTKTDSNGIFSLENLDTGNLDLVFKSEEYPDTRQTVEISRAPFEYTIKRLIKLTKGERASLKGKLIFDNYKFVNEKVKIDDKEYPLTESGEFNITNLKVGKQIFKFESSNFKDVSTLLDLKTGVNTLADIKVITAGDIQGSLKSYVNEDIVVSPKIEAENVPSSNIIIGSDSFTIKDLDTSKDYKVRISATGYNSSDYVVNTVQGVNLIKDLRFVETGKVAYISLDSDTNEPQIFSANLDGSNEKKLTSIKRLDPKSLYFTPNGNEIYFQSSFDGDYGRGGYLNLVYKIDLSTSQLTKVTVASDSLGDIYPNYSAQKMINTYQTGSGYSLGVCDLPCTSTKQILQVDNANFTSFVISDNGQKLVVKVSQTSSQAPSLKDGIYLIDINSLTKKTVTEISTSQVFDISPDGKYVLYSRVNSSTGFNDLVLYNSEKNEARTLRENHNGYKYIFDKNDSNLVYFITKKDTKFEIDQFNIDKNEINKFIQISTDEELLNIALRNGYIFYTTSKGLYISSISEPESFKFVTNKLNQFIGDSL